ncbi:TIGR01777 family oxidoreductase [Dactylosporangium matsuzakiense]|uniref:Epimerase n=1 Tax=Dactylosporangium matsuzakiense TaxID=53360 RepID=A0A9W6KJN7_9ACTN|nr:epimerase [Dactylosporangium matsuzakiense]
MPIGWYKSEVKIVLAGGTGALGRRIAADLAERGDEIVILTRRSRRDVPHRQVEWDGATVEDWAAELSGAAVINLAGELVDRRPTAKNIELLRLSRVRPTCALVEAAAVLAEPPAVWLQASTLAIYGDAGEAELDEDAEPADGPPQMAGVARAWESAAALTEAATFHRAIVGTRQAILRTGIVLDRGTPALDRLAGLVRWGLGGRVGTGQQWISWIHIADFLAVVRHVLTDASMSGIVHVTGPNPVRNTELMSTLRAVLRRPPAPPTPAAAVRLGALVLRTDPALALTGRRCIPRRLLAAGFDFKHPALGPALRDLLVP